ncbi:olfactory receptor 1571-like [Tachyglossus aculeatus]|uniref:olfactory receptor 1571-like n=1 Tax=Tachyglossus aculeatus TaxID=9261 RepID=UPI0018F3E837|nr:olfactory receptor 1571-like [Tachyglossus aculeatus]
MVEVSLFMKGRDSDNKDSLLTKSHTTSQEGPGQKPEAECLFVSNKELREPWRVGPKGPETLENSPAMSLFPVRTALEFPITEFIPRGYRGGGQLMQITLPNRPQDNLHRRTSAFMLLLRYRDYSLSQIHSSMVEQWQLLLVLFLWLYLLGIVGSQLIVLAIDSDPHLHTPMYFFLTNLSLADISFLTHDKSISYAGCLAQMYFFILFGGLDHFLLTGMAYDRYEAICQPLHYTTIMSPRLCSLLVAGSWIVSSLHALTPTLLVVRLSFCSNREILHFFCELYQILKLSCSSVVINERILLVFAVVTGVGPIFGLLFSYIRIISTILRIPSAGGRWKAFSTCGSHLSVVSLFYNTILGTYLCPTSTQAFSKGSIVSVLYTVVIPTMNPFIYSLRNKNMKEALRNTFNRKSVFFRGF